MTFRTFRSHGAAGTAAAAASFTLFLGAALLGGCGRSGTCDSSAVSNASAAPSAAPAASPEEEARRKRNEAAIAQLRAQSEDYMKNARTVALVPATVLAAALLAGCGRDTAGSADAVAAPGGGAGSGTADAVSASRPGERPEQLVGEWRLKGGGPDDKTQNRLRLGADGKFALVQTYPDSGPGRSGMVTRERTGTWSAPEDGLTLRYGDGGQVEYRRTLMDERTLVLKNPSNSQFSFTYLRGK